MPLYAVIRCAWDGEVGVWYVRESNVSGLATEAQTLNALRWKLPGTIQELLDVDAADLSFDLVV